MNEFAVELRDVIKTFQTPEGAPVNAVDHVDLEIKNGEFFSMLGSSGCGKTTSLRMIAGFEWPTSGELFIEGQAQGHKPPFQRPVNTVFQNYALFQHMTVYDNVAFGLEMAKTPKDETRRRVGEALEMVKLGSMEKRYPKQLSGGQQQRVALARALVNRPQVLLLDEPLGALDQKLRKEMQIELKLLQKEVGITFIFVTHDQEEALSMSDRIAVMSHGKVLQIGSPVEIYERPNCRFVADFIGETNFLQGEVRFIDGDKVTVYVPDLENEVTGTGYQTFHNGQQVYLSVRPEKITLAERSVLNHNTFPASVLQASYIGSDTRVLARVGKTVLKVIEQNKISTLDPEAYFQQNEQAFATLFPENTLVLPMD
ncbi:MAG: spermidine/putrescine ABC transporter ATP-binding protein [Chloroflexi bacterium HGW-Chloroflexi-6]|nr:MAG: spermidine/putrescine ABC transporter ATP-binding protein [Chloroflexi bacterium HGW-Chloroflexi-6]